MSLRSLSRRTKRKPVHALGAAHSGLPRPVHLSCDGQNLFEVVSNRAKHATCLSMWPLTRARVPASETEWGACVFGPPGFCNTPGFCDTIVSIVFALMLLQGESTAAKAFSFVIS